MQPQKSKRKTENRQKTLTLATLCLCLFCIGGALFATIDRQNQLTELRMAIPQLAKELRALQEENMRLKYEMERMESPLYLMELSRKPEFAHLKSPLRNEVIILP